MNKTSFPLITAIPPSQVPIKNPIVKNKITFDSLGEVNRKKIKLNYEVEEQTQQQKEIDKNVKNGIKPKV